jgi:predicted dehydrogenase
MNSKIRVAFYGTRHSHFSGKLKAVAANADYEIAGICEPDAKPPNVPYPVLSEQQMLDDKSISLVVVEAPPAEGIPYGEKVLKAGKHLHIEKPPSREWKPFQQLVEQARARQLLLQTGYIWRFHQGFRRIMQATRNLWIGHVYLIRASIPTDIPPSSQQQLSQFKGGMMFELGCHPIDRIVAMMGSPRNVKSWLQKVGEEGLADNTLAVLEFDHVLAVVSSSASLPNASPQRSFEVLGTDGAMILQPVEPGTQLRVNLREARGPYKAGWQTIEMPPQPRYTGDFADMARAIQTKTPLFYSYDFELLVHETVLRAAQEL